MECFWTFQLTISITIRFQRNIQFILFRILMWLPYNVPRSVTPAVSRQMTIFVTVWWLDIELQQNEWLWNILMVNRTQMWYPRHCPKPMPRVVFSENIHADWTNYADCRSCFQLTLSRVRTINTQHYKGTKYANTQSCSISLCECPSRCWNAQLWMNICLKWLCLIDWSAVVFLLFL